MLAIEQPEGPRRVTFALTSLIGALPLTLLSGLILVLVLGANVFLRFTCIAAAVVSFAYSAMLLIHGLTLRTGNARHITLSPWVLIAALGWLLVVVSAVPLPGHMDIVGGPRRYAQNNRVREAVAIARETRVSNAPAPHFSISRNRAGSLRIAILIAMAVAAANLSAMSTMIARRRYLYFLALLVGGFAATGLLHQWFIRPPDRMVWWFFRIPDSAGSRPVGCFLNRDHYAGFISLLATIPLVLLGNAIVRRRWLEIPVLVICLIIATLAVVASLSRGAFLAYCSSLFITILIGFRTRRRPLRLFIAAALLCLLVTGSLAMVSRLAPNHRTVRAVTERLSTLRNPLATHSGQSRLSMWADSLTIWARYPLLGAGGDSFRMVYPSYRNRTDREASEHAENEYLEFLADTGMLGVLMLGCMIVAILREWKRNYPNLRAGGISLAVSGSCIAAGVHNFLDFPLHTTLYTLVFSSLLGLTLSSPINQPLNREKYSLRLHYGIPAGLMIFVGILCILVATILKGVPLIRDNSRYVAHRASLNDDRELVNCLSGAPTSWFAWYSFARLGSQNFTVGDDQFARFCIEQAVKYDPKNYLLWERVGYLRRRHGDKDGADEAFAAMQDLRSWKRPRAPDLHGDTP